MGNQIKKPLAIKKRWFPTMAKKWKYSSKMVRSMELYTWRCHYSSPPSLSTGKLDCWNPPSMGSPHESIEGCDLRSASHLLNPKTHKIFELWSGTGISPFIYSLRRATLWRHEHSMSRCRFYHVWKRSSTGSQIYSWCFQTCFWLEKKELGPDIYEESSGKKNAKSVTSK